MAFTRRIFTKEFRLNAAKLVVDEHRPAVLGELLKYPQMN